MRRILTPSTYSDYLLYATSAYSIQRVLTLCTKYLLYANSPYSMQRVLTQCNKYLLYATNTYSIQQLHALCNGTYSRHEYLLYATSTYTTSTYSIQLVLTIYNEYLPYTTVTFFDLLYTKGTYSIQQVPILCKK